MAICTKYNNRHICPSQNKLFKEEVRSVCKKIYNSLNNNWEKRWVIYEHTIILTFDNKNYMI